MIEFRAECGHTIRAKDDDAGKVIRCSYCGKNASVPRDANDELTSLFQDLGAGGSPVVIPDRKGKRRNRAPREPIDPTLAPRRQGFDVFQVILKMVYAAIIITVVAIVGSKAWDYFSTFGTNGPENPEVTAARESGSSSARPAPSTSMGLIGASLDASRSGLYMLSAPEGARVYVRGDASRTFGAGSTITESDFKGVTPLVYAIEPGNYSVVMALPLNDRGLMRLPGYSELRRTLEQSRDVRPAIDFFRMDGCCDVRLLDLANGQLYLARVFDAKVAERNWVLRSGLWLPNGSIRDVVGFLPSKDSFGFDETLAVQELGFYEVPRSLHRYYVDMLRRIGVVFYPCGGNATYRMFWIGLENGSVLTAEFEAPEAVRPSVKTEDQPLTDLRRGAPRSLGSVDSLRGAAQRMREIYDSGGWIDVEDWKRFLVNGADYNRLWRSADARDQVTLLNRMDPQTATDLAAVLGQMLLTESNGDVQIAIGYLLALGESKLGLDYLDRRIRELGRRSGEDAEARKVCDSLKDAKRELENKLRR